MTILVAIETATEACSVALWQDGVTQEIFELAPRRHSELVLQFVNRLLHTAQLNIAQVDAFAFGMGPGSFMGVRLATAVAQGLAFALKKPVIPVSTLQALAQSAYSQIKQNNIVVAWDARMHEIYWGQYKLDQNGIMRAVIEDQLSLPNGINLASIHFPCVAVGNGWKIYQDLLEPVLNQCVLIEQDIYPHAAAIAEIAANFYQSEEKLSPLLSAPNYLRLDVAKKKIR